jgi:N-acetylmuramoyl-L-alanine amidase
MRVALAVGHDSRKRGVKGNAGLYEWEYNKILAHRIKDTLDSFDSGIQVEIFYRNENIRGYSRKMIELHNRISKFNADLAIELHFNGANNRNVQGHEVLYYHSCNISRKYAISLLESYRELLPNKSRGLKPITRVGRGAGFLRRCIHVRYATLIAEPFFANEQRNFMPHGSYWQNIVGSYVEFLMKVS